MSILFQWENSISDYNKYLTDSGFVNVKTVGWCKNGKIIKIITEGISIKVVVMKTVGEGIDIITEIKDMRMKYFERIINLIIEREKISEDEILDINPQKVSENVRIVSCKKKKKEKQKQKKKQKYIPRDAMEHRIPGNFGSGK